MSEIKIGDRVEVVVSDLTTNVNGEEVSIPVGALGTVIGQNEFRFGIWPYHVKLDMETDDEGGLYDDYEIRKVES